MKSCESLLTQSDSKTQLTKTNCKIDPLWCIVENPYTGPASSASQWLPINVNCEIWCLKTTKNYVYFENAKSYEGDTNGNI